MRATLAETTCDGVYTHGINRFLALLAIHNGCVDPGAEPELCEVWRAGALGWAERPWQSERAYLHGSGDSFGRVHGVGCVSLRNTNHWMRGGTYGWQAAEAGVIGICWTNTMPNLPPWGGDGARAWETTLW